MTRYYYFPVSCAQHFVDFPSLVLTWGRFDVAVGPLAVLGVEGPHLLRQLRAKSEGVSHTHEW